MLLNYEIISHFWGTPGTLGEGPMFLVTSYRNVKSFSQLVCSSSLEGVEEKLSSEK